MDGLMLSCCCGKYIMKEKNSITLIRKNFPTNGNPHYFPESTTSRYQMVMTQIVKTSYVEYIQTFIHKINNGARQTLADRQEKKKCVQNEIQMGNKTNQCNQCSLASWKGRKPQVIEDRMKAVSQTLHISAEDWIFIHHALYSGHVPKSSLGT